MRKLLFLLCALPGIAWASNAREIYTYMGNDYAAVDMVLFDDERFSILCEFMESGDIVSYTGRYEEGLNVWDFHFEEFAKNSGASRPVRADDLEHLFGNSWEAGRIKTKPLSRRINKHPKELFVCNVRLTPAPLRMLPGQNWTR